VSVGSLYNRSIVTFFSSCHPSLFFFFFFFFFFFSSVMF